MGQVIEIDQTAWNMLLTYKQNIRFWSGHPEFQSALDKTKDLYFERINSLVA